jgi:hypothetical protein
VTTNQEVAGSSPAGRANSHKNQSFTRARHRDCFVPVFPGHEPEGRGTNHSFSRNPRPFALDTERPNGEIALFLPLHIVEHVTSLLGYSKALTPRGTWSSMRLPQL